MRRTKSENNDKSNVKIPPGMLKISFCDYLRKYYSTKELEIESSSFKGYENIIEKHIVPYFKKKKLLFVDISSQEINQYLDYKLDDGLSPSTVKKHRDVIGQALRAAYNKGWMPDNIMSSVNEVDFTVSQISTKVISTDILQSVLSVSKGTDLFIPAMLSTKYGLDRAEILGLRWSDVDFENKTIHIQNVVIKGSSGAFDIHPANDIAERTLPIFETDIDQLCFARQRQTELRSANKNYCKKYYDYINVTNKGIVIGPDNLSKKLNDLLQKNNIEKTSFSDLRKAYATLLKSMGFNDNAICSWMGIASISTIGCKFNDRLVANQINLVKAGLEFYENGEL